jgi:hypothetical protein
MTVADLTIDGLAQRVVELEAEVCAYRELAHTAIHALHEQTAATARQRDRYLWLLEECRALRAQMRKADAA